MRNKEKAAGAGMILSALLASVCCIGPVVFAVLGVGAVGLSSALLPWRPAFIGMTLIFLGLGFYFAYRKPAADCPDESCQPSRTVRRNRLFLWVAAVVAAFFILLPYFPFSPPKAGNAAASTSQVDLFVEGMTCSSCDAAVETAVKKLPGVTAVTARHDSGKVWVSLDTLQVSPEQVAAAIRRLGYPAEVANQKSGVAPAVERKEKK